MPRVKWDRSNLVLEEDPGTEGQSNDQASKKNSHVSSPTPHPTSPTSFRPSNTLSKSPCRPQLSRISHRPRWSPSTNHHRHISKRPSQAATNISLREGSLSSHSHRRLSRGCRSLPLEEPMANSHRKMSQWLSPFKIFHRWLSRSSLRHLSVRSTQLRGTHLRGKDRIMGCKRMPVGPV